MDRLLTVVYLPPCLFFLLATLKLSAWTRLRILVAYGGFALTLLVIPLVSGGGGPSLRNMTSW
jgi:hypothetical protein